MTIHRGYKVKDSGCTHLEVEVEKAQLEVESSTNGTRRRQLMAL